MTRSSSWPPSRSLPRGTDPFPTRWLGALAGIVSLIVGLLFIFRAHHELRAAHVPGVGLTDLVGMAAYVCTAGGALALLGGVLALRAGRGSI